MNNPDLDYLILFGGGSVWGFSYLGAQKALNEIGVRPSAYAGSSVGAIFAAFCAVGASTSTMHDIFMDINFELFKDINFNFKNEFAISKGGVFYEWIKANIEQIVYKENYQKGKNPPVTFASIDKDLAIFASDLADCQPFIFSKKTTPDTEIAYAVRVSASLPGLLSPYTAENKILCDGDLMKSWPLWRLWNEFDIDDRRVLEFRLEGVTKKEKITSFSEYFNMLYGCISNYATSFIIDLYKSKDKFDYIKINPENISLVNFNLTKDEKKFLIDLGYKTTMSYFKNQLPLKKQNLLVDYRNILNQLKTLKKEIERNKILNAKCTLGEIFMDMCEFKKFIDMKYYDELVDFKNAFNLNTRKLLFGKYSLKNEKLVLAKLQNLIERYHNKCDNLINSSGV